MGVPEQAVEEVTRDARKRVASSPLPEEISIEYLTLAPEPELPVI
jgi:hypothetical protein